MSVRVGVAARPTDGRSLGHSPLSHICTDCDQPQGSLAVFVQLERAHALLSETDMSITQITAATGFNSTSHLARQFKSKYGFAPRYMRKGWAK